jgi:hypothetical protein
MPGEESLPHFSAHSASKIANFYSIQISPFLPTPIFQPTENKALSFFYSIQMSGHKSLLTNRESLLTNAANEPV